MELLVCKVFAVKKKSEKTKTKLKNERFSWTLFFLQVHCEHGASTSYTVILRRQDGSVSFYQPFQYYLDGFGHPQYEYWAGLNAIYHLTYIGKSKESGESCFTCIRTMHLYVSVIRAM